MLYIYDIIETRVGRGQIVGILYKNNNEAYFSGIKVITDYVILSDFNYENKISSALRHWKAFGPESKGLEILELSPLLDKIPDKKYRWIKKSEALLPITLTTIVFPDKTSKMLNMNPVLGLKFLYPHNDDLREYEIDELTEDKATAWVV